MPENDPAAIIAHEWVQKADGDLRTATVTLTLGADCPAETVCFHAQQSAEKYLKALLVFKRIVFPRTHSIPMLMELLPKEMRPELNVIDQNRLTEYATVTRYPGDYDPISLAEARHAVKLAGQIRKVIMRHIPSVH
jgi:HEPN domain-containing protein